MVYDTYNYSIDGVYKPTNITGGGLTMYDMGISAQKKCVGGFDDEPNSLNLDGLIPPTSVK